MPDRQAPGPLLTIREASQATGLSIKALRGRVERGSLEAVTVGDRRRIPLSELLRAGLLHTEPPDIGAEAPGERNSRLRGTSSGYPVGSREGFLEVVAERLDALSSRVDQVATAVARIERALLSRGDDKT